MNNKDRLRAERESEPEEARQERLKKRREISWRYEQRKKARLGLYGPPKPPMSAEELNARRNAAKKKRREENIEVQREKARQAYRRWFSSLSEEKRELIRERKRKKRSVLSELKALRRPNLETIRYESDEQRAARKKAARHAYFLARKDEAAFSNFCWLHGVTQISNELRQAYLLQLQNRRALKALKKEIENGHK